MQKLHIFFGIISASNSGLVGNNQHQETSLIQQPDSFLRTRDELKFLNTVKIIFFHIDCSVTIQKYCTFHTPTPATI